MNKTFEIKRYNLTWTFLNPIKKDDLISDLSFSNSINSWQWDCNLEFNLSIWNNDFSLWDFWKIYVYTDIYPNWKLIYTWIINIIVWNITSWKESIAITLIWLWSLLTFRYFYSWSYICWSVIWCTFRHTAKWDKTWRQTAFWYYYN